MADLNTVQPPAITPGTEQPPAGQPPVVAPPQTVSVDELAKIQAAHDAEVTRIKAGQSGTDKLNAELKARITESDKRIADLEKKGMSEEKRQEYERAKFESDKAELERERKELKTESLKSDFMLKNQIDPEWRPFIHAEDEDGLKAEVEKIKALILKATAPLQLELDKFNAAAGKPGGGASTVPKDAKAKMLEAEAKFREAQAKGDHAAQQAAADEAFYWKEQAARLKT